MSRYGDPDYPYGAHPGYPDQYPPEPGYPPAPDYPRGSGYPPAPGYPPEPGYPPDPGYPADRGFDPHREVDPEFEYEPEPEPESEPEPRRSSGLRIGGSSPALVVAAVGVMALVGLAVAYALYLLSTGSDGDDPGSVPVAADSPDAVADPEATRNNIGLNAAMALAGNCLTNLGSEIEPQLQIVECEDADYDGPLYEVLTRVDTEVEGEDRTAQDSFAQQACTDTDGYTHHYFEVSESLSFVLCMAEYEPPEDDADETDADADEADAEEAAA